MCHCHLKSLVFLFMFCVFHILVGFKRRLHMHSLSYTISFLTLCSTISYVSWTWMLVLLKVNQLKDGWKDEWITACCLPGVSSSVVSLLPNHSSARRPSETSLNGKESMSTYLFFCLYFPTIILMLTDVNQDWWWWCALCSDVCSVLWKNNVSNLSLNNI